MMQISCFATSHGCSTGLGSGPLTSFQLRDMMCYPAISCANAGTDMVGNDAQVGWGI